MQDMMDPKIFACSASRILHLCMQILYGLQDNF